MEDHTSAREKVRLESLSLPQLGTWLAAATIPALGLHLHPNELRVSATYRRIIIKTYNLERKCLLRFGLSGFIC